jgi:hypothetical protein
MTHRAFIIMSDIMGFIFVILLIVFVIIFVIGYVRYLLSGADMDNPSYKYKYNHCRNY